MFNHGDKQWSQTYILSYSPTTRKHCVYKNGEFSELSLGHYPVKYMNQNDVQFSISNVNVIEYRDSIRCYKKYDYFTEYEQRAFHNLPQIVFFYREFHLAILFIAFWNL